MSNVGPLQYWQCGATCIANTQLQDSLNFDFS